MKQLHKSFSLSLQTILEDVSNDDGQDDEDKYKLEDHFTFHAYKEDPDAEYSSKSFTVATPYASVEVKKNFRPYSAMEKRFHYIPPEDDFIAQLEELRAQRLNK